MAARLRLLLGTSAESWLAMQNAVGLWEIGQRPELLAWGEPMMGRPDLNAA